MSLDDRAADRQPDAHAAALGRVEGIKELVHSLPVDARAGIPHGHAHAIAVLPFGSDQQVPRAVVDADHRVRGVAKQVQEDLLKLDTIANERREIISELRLNDDAVSLKLGQ